MRSGIMLIVASLGLLPVASDAQEAGGAVACPSIQNDQERLACYDRAMRGGPAPQAFSTPAPTAAPVTATPPAAIAAPVVVAGGAAAAAAPATTGSATVAPAAAVVGAATATALAAPSAQAAAAPASAAATPSSTISTAPHTGRNTHAATPPQPGAPPTFDPNTGAPTGIYPVVIVSALARPGFGTEFTTDTAGVWVQTETKPLTLPKAPFNAQLQPGTFGSTFLVLPDRKMGIRVRPPNN